MGDRYRYSSGRRSPVYGPGRASAPNVTTYYGGDIHVTPSTRYVPSTSTTQPPSSSSSHHNHHHRRSSNSNQFSDWRGPPVSVPVSGPVPVTTTTYTVRKDPVTRSASVREHSRNRASTLDNRSSTFEVVKRPPIVVTTRVAKEAPSTQDGSYTPRREAPSSTDRGRDYRETDDYYAQPASSIRSRSHTRPHASGSISSTLDNEEVHRLRQRTNDGRLQPSWNEPRRERPTSFYAAMPRHGAPTTDMGDSGYEYTKPSDLVRYDLDNDRRPARDTYYRPTVTLNDVDRRPYDSRARGPPPTTRGLDKVNRRVVEDPTGGIYDRPSVRMPVPVVVPTPAADRRSTQLDVPPSPIERRPSRNGHRPVSLYQESSSRASRVDEPVFREQRAPRDRDRDYYRDESVGRRGSLRPEAEKRKDPLVEDLGRDRDRRRDSRLEERGREPRRHSDEELDRHARRQSRDYSRKEESPIRPERKIVKDNSSRKDDISRDDDRDKDKFRDKVVTGLSLAAGAVGLGGVLSHKDKDKDDKEDKGSPKRREDDDVRRDEVEDRSKPRREAEDRPRDNGIPSEPVKKSRKDRDLEDLEDTERNRRDAEAKLNGESNVKDSNSSSDESKPRRRRRPSSAAFKPNDTASLMALKEQLKAKEGSDKENEKISSHDSSPDRRSQHSPPREGDIDDPRSSKEDLRGREAQPSDDKQVRVVSPPRDKDDKKPIKGILKQPKQQFPEEPNPVREGVAPHKDDKTKGSVPPGARWTKISRKLVNPDALTVGKERFEVRDDFVIVLRVLSKEEIEAYTAATAQLRGGLLPFHFSCLSFPFVAARRRAAHT